MRSHYCHYPDQESVDELNRANTNLFYPWRVAFRDWEAVAGAPNTERAMQWEPDIYITLQPHRCHQPVPEPSWGEEHVRWTGLSTRLVAQWL